MKKTNFVCLECGYVTLKWMGKCPSCNSWNTLEEYKELKEEKKARDKQYFTGENPLEGPISLTDMEFSKEERVETGLSELDRVLGGGLFPGSVVLIGGDPGIGKSTLMLQISYQLADKLYPVYYLSGEESPSQVLDRCNRLKAIHKNIYISCETNLEKIAEELDKLKPKTIIIDSIQSIYYPPATSLPGSLKQVKESSARLVRYVKDHGMSCFVVGHITKVGDIAGPKVLEHMVDTVLSFEGEKQYSYRILRSNKNRFGATDIGVFEMKEDGLCEVQNPSKLFLNGREGYESGSCVTASMEGRRPVLVEIQSLTGRTNFTSPRRMTAGLDYNRVLLIVAVLEKRLNLNLGYHDIFVNVVGGLKLNEPAVDLAVAISLVSSYKNKKIDRGLIAFGEIGLTGEVRQVDNLKSRLKEAKKMGFKKALIPSGSIDDWMLDFGDLQDLEVVQVKNLKEALVKAGEY